MAAYVVLPYVRAGTRAGLMHNWVAIVIVVAVIVWRHLRKLQRRGFTLKRSQTYEAFNSWGRYAKNPRGFLVEATWSGRSPTRR